MTAYHGEKTVGSVYSGEDGTFIMNPGVPVDAVSVTLLGYKVFRQEITTPREFLEIHLSRTNLEIKAASVRASVIEERGDTLTYTAQAFSDGSERVLGELLEKLPGISVNASSGTIYHNNRPINKFYIEGLDLMGSRYGVVTQNLPSDKIARIEILQRHQPVKALQGIETNGESAVNIILKESERNAWALGLNGMLGAPPIPLFSAHATLTRFARNAQNLFLIKGNNVGNDILRELQEQQYFGKARSFVVDTQNADADFASELRPNRTELPLPQPYWYNNLSGITSLNHLVRTGNDSQLRVGLNGAAERFREQSVTREEVRLNGSDALLIQEERTLSDRRYYADLSASWEHNAEQRYFSETFKLAGQWRDALSALSREDPYAQQYTLPSFKAENQLRLTTRMREDRALDLSSDTRFTRNIHSADYKTASLHAVQELTASRFRSENEAKLGFRTGRLQWEGAGGLDIDYNNTHVRLTGLSAQGIPDAPVENGIFSLRPHIRLRTTFFLGRSQWTASLPGSLSFVSTKGKSLLVPGFSPSLSVLLRFSPAWEFSASGLWSRTHSAPESLLDAFIMQDWRTLARRDSLRQTDRLAVSAQLKFSDNLNMLFASLSGNYDLRRNDRAASYQYEEGLTFRTYLPVTRSSDKYSVTGRVSKYFGARWFVADLSCTAMWSSTNEFLQGKAVDYLDRTVTGSLAVRFNPAPWLSGSLNGTYSWMVIQGDAPLHCRTARAEGSISIRPVRGLTIGLLGYGLWQQVPGQQISNRPLMDASIGWKTGKFEWILECRNLLGCTVFSRESISAWKSVSTVSNLCGRQFLFSLRAAL
ncbi:MAG: hypothetical protein IJV37_01395 [Bacteroidales bacterium]|nr:hypothetical protein [Bacteroidales bacterium]